MRLVLWIAAGVLLAPAQETPTFRGAVALIHVDAEVTDGTRTLSGFRQENFVVKDNGIPQSILYFAQEEEPLDVILLFDISGSMRPNVEKVAASSRLAFAELRQGDRIAIMTFHSRSRLVAPFSEDLEAVARIIQIDVMGGKFRGGTRLLAGIDDAAKHFLDEPRTQRRRAIVIVTDNFGTRSRRVSTVVHRLWEADASLSGLIIRDGFATAMRTVAGVTNPLALTLREGFDSVAEQTGGDAIKADDAGQAFRELMRRQRQRYSLYYLMPLGEPGEKRKITVELSPGTLAGAPTARVRARKGYVVPGGR